MKRILILIATILIFCMTIIPVAAEESGETAPVVTEEITEIITESTTEIHIDEEVASEVVGIIEQSESKADAILATAEKLGITAEEAEAIINSVLEFGDLYLGESAWWLGFKDDIQKNMNFWVTVIVCIAAVIAIIGVIFVLLAKTNPTMRKAMFGMDDALKIAREQSDANSQTLGKIEKLALDTAAKDEAYNKIIDEKEDRIMQLSKQIKDLQIANKKERRSMVLAESYNLQILRLLCSRTALPLQDKAAIDLWFTKANESLKSELSAEDIKKIDTIATTLEVKDEETV